MWILLSLTTVLCLAQIGCLARTRQKSERLMRPGDLWEAEDLDHWLALIEPIDFTPTRR